MHENGPERSDADERAAGQRGSAAAAEDATYKILGALRAADGTAILGTNDATSGTPVGVEGATPNASSGYGLSTPDDARVEGTAELGALAGGVTGDARLTSLLGDGLIAAGETLALGPTSVETETASTFAESSVTVSHDGTRVNNGAIELGTATVAASRPPDDTSVDVTGVSGLRFITKIDASSITVTISENTAGESTVYLRTRDGSVIKQKPSPGAGNSVTIPAEIRGGFEYQVVVDDGGDQYTCGVDSDSSFPYTSTVADIVAGIDEGSTRAPARAISKIEMTGEANSGSATVEWPRPPSVRRWETATFDADPDGQTVEVYVETSSDGGSTWSDWQPKPIGPGTDLSAIPAGDRVRFRSELSRPDTGDNPRLTLLSRQYSP